MIFSLKDIEQQTEEICLYFVKNLNIGKDLGYKSNFQLQYVKEQTYNICQAAVGHYGLSLQYVKLQTIKLKIK